jgi:phage terminase large subunit GpA-like protein
MKSARGFTKLRTAAYVYNIAQLCDFLLILLITKKKKKEREKYHMHRHVFEQERTN